MKKLLTIFLLGAMLLFSMGYYVVYKFNLRSIKQQMRLAIRQGDFNTHELISFTFDACDPNSITDLEVKEEGKEIRYKGSMYDVVAVTFNGSQLVIFCLADNEESNVIAGFAKFLDDSGAKASRKPVKMVKYNLPVFTIDELPANIFNSYGYKCIYSWYRPAFIPLHFLSKPSPPPWLA